MTKPILLLAVTAAVTVAAALVAVVQAQQPKQQQTVRCIEAALGCETGALSQMFLSDAD